MTFTTQQILALAPNSGNAARGQELALPSKWELLAFDDGAVWGACKGSGKNPYRTVIDLNGPAFKCSCPSREFPCKHGIALFLLFSGMRDKFSGGAQPDWASEWLDKRKQKSEAVAEKAKEPVSAEKLAAQEANREKRVANRWENMEAGAAQLELWLHDLIRHGLGSVNLADSRQWEAVAKRLVDAQLPGLAEMVRKLGTLGHKKEGHSHFFAALCDLQFVLEGIRNRAQLSPAQSADLDFLVGIPSRKEDVLATDGFEDDWLALGTREVLGNIPARRTWLWGLQSGKWGLQVDFSFGNQGFGAGRLAGSVVRGKWHYYPGSFPLRGLFSSESEVRHDAPLAGFAADWDSCLHQYADAMAAFPLVWEFPFWIDGVVPVLDNGLACLCDRNGRTLPIETNGNAFYTLMALSGGQPLAVLAEWNGHSLFLVSAFVNNLFYPL